MHASALSLNGRPRERGGGALATGRATRSLVLWSGGVDSTYTLLRLLKETGDEVFSHHVRLGSGDGNDASSLRGTLEAGAIAALAPAVTACSRAFTHTACRVESMVPGLGGDSALLSFMGARVALANGFTPFDRILVGVNGDRDPGWDPDTAACALRRARLARAIRAAYGCDEVPQVYLWQPRPRRSDMTAYLGAELAALTASCWRPLAAHGTAPRPCGRCPRCRERHSPGARAGEQVTPSPGHAPAARTAPPFRHLVELQSRRPEPPGEAAASDPPGP